MAPSDSPLKLADEIQRDARTILFRGTYGAESRPVRVRVPALRQARDIAAIHREHDMLGRLHSDRVAAVLTLMESAHGPTLVLADQAEVLLSDMIPVGGLPLDRFLPLAHEMATALEEVHARDMVHRDVRPASFWVASDGVTVTLGNFCRASLVPNEAALGLGAGRLDGDLRYLSPEQTGRMNRVVDYRSDLYSLGLCFYEMLTGQLPFQAGDPVGWVHCHIAREPRPIRELRPDLPEPMGELVMRLLAKAAEQRYQLAATVKSDLATAMLEWRATGALTRFQPSRGDRPRQLVLPQRLFGRDLEVGQMLAAFERAADGAVEFLAVAGSSGIGKSVLVREVQRPLTARRGYYAEGKFDQLRRDVPFLALIQPLRDLVKQVLTEPPEVLAHWADRLSRALDRNAAVMAEALPELELVLGKQPAPQPLPPIQAQNRFQQTVACFLLQFASIEHPLVLFLDDLQWADTASLKLLEALLVDPDARHLLVVGAYRDQEVEAGHPLTRLLAAIQPAIRTSTIVPQPLEPPHVRAWLAEALGTDDAEVVLLSEMLTAKTGGNPFFLGQLLTTLAATHVIRFDAQIGCWRGDVAAVERASLPDDVADLLAARLGVLPDQTQDVLRLAACIGNRFELGLLAAICRLTPEVALVRLDPALRDGYCVLVEDEGGAASIYRFTHDRLHKAAYLLTPEAERSRVHLELGRRLRDDAGLAERLPFEVVRHLNLGSALITQEAELRSLAHLNHGAALKARGSAAFDIAHGLFRWAMELLPLGGEVEFRWRLWMDAAEAAYLVQDFDDFQARRTELEALAADDLQRAELLELVVLANEARNNFNDALDAAVAGLRLLDLPLSLENAKRDTLRLIAQVFWRLGRRSAADLAALPAMQDARVLQVMRLLASAIRASYSLASPLLPVLSLKGVLLSLRHGMTAYATNCFTGSALIFIGALKDIPRGSRLGDTAMRLGERFDTVVHVPNHVVVVQHWTSPLRDMAIVAAEVSKELLANGFYDRAGLCLMGEMTCHTVCRTDLEQELRSTQAAMAFAQRRDLRLIVETARNPLALIDRLRRPEAGGLDAILPYEGLADSRTGEIAFKIRQMYTALVFDRTDLVRTLAGEVRPALRSVLGSAWVAPFHWYEALALLDGCGGRVPAQVRTNLKLLRLWARHAPMNNAHRVRLLEAEMASLTGAGDLSQRAATAFADAVDLAMEEGFVGDAALAAERHGRALLRLDRRRQAAAQMREAWLLYRRYGALGKAAQLAGEFPDALEGLSADGGAEDGGGSQALDVSTVTKMGQAIAGELVLGRLTGGVLDLAMENAGARYAALTLVDPDGRTIAAERSLGDTPVEQGGNVAGRLPEPLLLYAERTLETVLIEDARVQTRFPAHRRWDRANAVSVLGVPVVHQGRCIGVLYLENDLTAGAFTADRVELLRVLASQAATAIANARLFDELDRARTALLEYNQRLEKVVSERTADLARRSTALEQSLTELRAAQAQLVQKEKLASLGGLVAGVAHEINTPLGVALTGASYFEERVLELAGQIEEKRLTRTGLDEFLADTREAVRTVVNNLRRSADLVQSFKQVAVGQGEGGLESLDLAQYLREILPPMQVLLEARQIRLEMALEEGLFLRAPAGAIARTLTHLVQNAVTHAFDGVAEPVVRLELRREGGEAVLSVTDNGVGMGLDVRERAFDPFFTTKRSAGATGLGLHIVHNLVTGSLTGTLDMATAPGQGTGITVRLPLSAEM
ncbi:AAA family ATPase [Niveispirillum sp. KHB5.9]|uniref:trifunctional serine/threonine-protein kinase/ATP-binding protein/sensor histidine kinase n=1 Tax=Niveispirillum sp. KHB5.9 TaxID=3400269 RepID=UPI003A866128